MIVLRYERATKILHNKDKFLNSESIVITTVFLKAGFRLLLMVTVLIAMLSYSAINCVNTKEGTFSSSVNGNKPVIRISPVIGHFDTLHSSRGPPFLSLR